MTLFHFFILGDFHIAAAWSNYATIRARNGGGYGYGYGSSFGSCFGSRFNTETHSQNPIEIQLLTHGTV